MMLSCYTAFAEVVVETSVSRSRLAVGEELVLDIVVANADGPISRPMVSNIEGFTSYSQGHSQEINIINGRTTSRSVFSYVLIANSMGARTLGPFEIEIGGKRYKVAPVQVEVVQTSSAASAIVPYPQTPVNAPPIRALPQGQVTDQDIFVRAWLDKDEVYVNEPVILTYTLYTRLSATYKGFEKEPMTTGFWVEDFPPEKTIRRTEQVFNGSRYVVAEVRKSALFPTEAGVFTIDPGSLSAVVELRSQDSFDSFFSYNIFGRRSRFPSSFTTDLVQKNIPADKIMLAVKALPETGRPASFTGAVGRYRIESALDKQEVEQGNPITYRIRVLGEGNISTLQAPSPPKLEDFKIYDSSTSTHISKNRLIVEGEKISETVMVPKKAGVYTIPPLGFAYFDPAAQTYKELKTFSHILAVKPGAQADSRQEPGVSVQPVEKEDVSLVGKDIRYIKLVDNAKLPPAVDGYRRPVYRLFNLFLFLSALILTFVNERKASAKMDLGALRLRRSEAAARRRLRSAASGMRRGKADEFYAEASKAVYGYFADKFNVSTQFVTLEFLEERLTDTDVSPELLSKIRELFHGLHFGRYARSEVSGEQIKEIHGLAVKVIAQFEKMKLK